jgi:hypothetical protein
VITAIVAYYVQKPINWDGLGKFGAIALLFPLHLLAVTLLATGLGWLALRRGISLATAAFGLVAMLTAFSAMWPSMLVWRMARQVHVSLSLGDYAANALHLNIGKPQRERSVVFGTASDGTKLELDVWRAHNTGTGNLRPAIVYIHGGAWSHGTRSGTPDWNRWLIELGFEVFDIEYRLIPAVLLCWPHTVWAIRRCRRLAMFRRLRSAPSSISTARRTWCWGTVPAAASNMSRMP